MGGQEGDDDALVDEVSKAETSEMIGIDGNEEDLPPLGGVPAPPTRGLAGLAFSHVKVEEFANMTGDSDNDDVEPTMASPLVSLGHNRDGVDFEHQDAEMFRGGTTSESPDHGDLDPTSRARDLISRDLLDELSHEPTPWSENRHPPTPPHGGFDTPSEPGTPRANQSQQYYHTQGNEGLSCIDQWDWKTDAPEFVPGSMKGMLGHTDSQVVGTPFSQPGAWAMQSAQALASNSGGNDEIARITEMRGNYEWQLRVKTDELRDMQQRLNQTEIETAQVRASWEVERRSLMRQIGHYRAVLERYCIPVDDAGTGYSMEEHGMYFPVFEPSAPSQWSTESTSARVPSAVMRPVPSNGVAFTTASARQVTHSSDSRPLRPLGGSSAANTPVIAKRAVEGEQTKSSLDSKMRQLNSLLREDNTSAQKDRQPSPDSSGHDNDPSHGSGNNYTGSSIASTLRSMFPHATIRTKTTLGENGEDEEDEALDNEFGVPASEIGLGARQRQSHAREADSISKFVDALEDFTGGHIDDRARKALQALSPNAGLEALAKVEEVIRQEGSACRNLSSILQSVCKKFEVRTEKAPRSRHKPDDTTSDGRQTGGNYLSDKPAGRTRRARRMDDDERDAFVSSESDGDAGSKAQSSAWPREFERAALRAAAKAAREDEARERSKEVHKAVQQADLGGVTRKKSSAGSKSWADLEDGDDDDKDAWEKDNDVWTPELVDRVARKGFELRRRGDHWDLKILMSQLEPPLTETGMERYCRWLRTRLTTFREEYGQDALWCCRGEVDFSHNQMSNQMVWMLLETLAQHEVQVALLKVSSNRISQGGVLAICEFIRQNERPEALQELHLSHNEIDDESALELLRTLKSQPPRYPQRSSERHGNVVHSPVWLRLSHNRIRDPTRILRTAEDESLGSPIQLSIDRIDRKRA